MNTGKVGMGKRVCANPTCGTILREYKARHKGRAYCYLCERKKNVVKGLPAKARILGLKFALQSVPVFD